MAIRASIILVCHGHREVTERCLRSLDAALGTALGDTWELVLVDNGSRDDTLALLQDWSDRGTVVALRQNRDFAGGCNAGATAARGEVLVFLNNDTEVAPGGLETLVDQALEPGVGAVGARLLYPDGTIQHAGVWMIREAETVNVVPYHLFQFEDGELPAARTVMDVECVTGACLVMRADRFAALDGFEEAYRNGWEDVDLCLRIRMSGDRIVYRGDVAIVHHEGSTRGRGQGNPLNPQLFYHRWAELLDDDLAAFREIWHAQYLPTPERELQADVLVSGGLSSLGPEGAQTRAVVAGLERLGRAPAASDDPPALIGPRMTQEEWGSSVRALQRRIDAELPTVAAGDLGPVIATTPCGPGGGGTLVVAPAHDLELSAALLRQAAAMQPSQPLTVWPTARTAQLVALVATLAPHAELLATSASEAELADRAATADLVFAADPADPWDRAALVCAGAGAAVICRPDGPAAAVLGDLAAAPQARSERAERVRVRCAPEQVLGPVVATPA